MKVDKLSPALGAQVTQLDLSREQPDSVYAQLRGALLEHSVLVIRGQSLDPAQFVSVSRQFGELEPYESTVREFLMPDHPEIILISNVKENGRNVGVEDAGQYWHTDRSYVPQPCWSSLLYAIEVPTDEAGTVHGDTHFSSTLAAFAALPESTRRRLRDMRAVHRYIYRYTRPAADRLPPVEHPIALSHPFNGRPSLYVNAGFTECIAGVDVAASQQMLNELYEHVARPEFIYTHHWQPGDIVMWDNFATQHKATGDYRLPMRRLMWRTTVRSPRQ